MVGVLLGELSEETAEEQVVLDGCGLVVSPNSSTLLKRSTLRIFLGLLRLVIVFLLALALQVQRLKLLGKVVANRLLLLLFLQGLSKVSSRREQLAEQNNDIPNPDRLPHRRLPRHQRLLRPRRRHRP